MYMFEDDHDMEFLRSLCKRLYSEDRMNGDNMRDMAQRLHILIERTHKIDDDNVIIQGATRQCTLS